MKNPGKLVHGKNPRTVEKSRPEKKGPLDSCGHRGGVKDVEAAITPLLGKKWGLCRSLKSLNPITPKTHYVTMASRPNLIRALM